MNRLLEQILANLHNTMLEGDGDSYDQIKIRYRKTFFEEMSGKHTWDDMKELINLYDPDKGTKYLEAITKVK
jgi:FAD/FMN-containing dehydrogenase